MNNSRPPLKIEEYAIFIGGSSNGRTTDFESVNLGSNPSPPAKFNSQIYSKCHTRNLLFISRHGVGGGVIEKDRRRIINEAFGKIDINFFTLLLVLLFSSVFQEFIYFDVYVSG